MSVRNKRQEKICDAGLHATFSISEFVGHQTGRGSPQYKEGDLSVSLATAWHVEVWQLGFRSQGDKFCSRHPRVFAHCVVDVPKGLDGMPLTTEFLTYPVETLTSFLRSFSQRGLQLFDCLVRASQHGGQVVRPKNARAFTMAPPTSIAMLAITSGYQLE